MRAATVHQIAITAYQKADVIECQRRPLAPYEVAGPTVVTLVSPGTELAWAYTAREGFPLVPGYAAVFRIAQVGSDVRDLASGDLALCMGQHASWQQHAFRDVVALPIGLAPELGVCARLMGVSMSTLTTTQARPPESVAISGLGPVGHLAAQIFQGAGYDVLATDPLASRRADARTAGVRCVVDSIPPDSGFALVVECSGHEQAVLDACRSVRKGGEVALVGVPWTRKTDIMAFELVHAVFNRYVHLRSGWEWEVPIHPEPFQHNSIHGQLAGALRWLAEGRIKLNGLYSKHSPLEAQQVYDNLFNQRAERLLTLFSWEDFTT